MSYGHGASIDHRPTGMSPKSAYVTGTRVLFTTGNGRRLLGEIAGPDQNFFPSPDEVFVSFPATGFTRLLPVTDLEIALSNIEGAELRDQA